MGGFFISRCAKSAWLVWEDRRLWAQVAAEVKEAVAGKDEVVVKLPLVLRLSEI